MATGDYRPVSEAEKRNLYADAGILWPNCDCHGVEKKWSPSSLHKPGGFWICAERRRQRDRKRQVRYQGSFEGQLSLGRGIRNRRVKRLQERKEKLNDV